MMQMSEVITNAVSNIRFGIYHIYGKTRELFTSDNSKFFKATLCPFEQQFALNFQEFKHK